ncbi:MAG: tetratricopeptide repeat protein [Acidobacteria bacterium]|nr:tetratricopeptide repeat protein [Acidobacteriota bacterium]
MPGYTRHQLKEDKLADAAKDTVHWAVAHRGKLIASGTMVGILLVAGLGGWAFLRHRDTQASVALGAAMRTYNTPLRSAESPAPPGVPSFTSAKERAQAAQKEFLDIGSRYSYTRNAEVARYMAGLVSVDLGDVAAAERELKAIAGSHNRDLAPLAKMALASLYRSQKREADAVKLYKELIDQPARTVPKSMAQLELATMYEASQPAEAMRIYQQIKTENPTSAAGQLASGRIAAVQK